MYQLIYPALFCVFVLFYTAPVAADSKPTAVQPLPSVAVQSSTTDWKQANKKVAELGGWQFYATESGGHQTMDHTQHSSSETMDHSSHNMPMNHSKHHNHQQMDHSQHTMPEQTNPQPEKTGDEHEHHH